MSPSREAIQAAAREAAEQAIHLADAEDRKSPNDHHATGKINLDSDPLETTVFFKIFKISWKIDKVNDAT